MKRPGLRDSVTLASTAVLAGVLIVVSVIGNLLLSRRLDADAANVLRNRADAQVVTLAASDGRLKIRESVNDQVLDQESWVFTGTRAIERARAGADIQAAAQSLADARRGTFLTVSGRVRLYARPVFDRGEGRDEVRVGTVVVGVSLTPYEHTERIARISTAALALIALLACAFTVRWSVGRALRPVEEMTERAADWSEHDLHRRFALGEPYDEISGLAATLDKLLARIDAALRREQLLTAEIAHELRTPLTSIRAEAELALRNGDTGDEAALRQVIAGTDRMSAAIETLLAAHVGDATTDRSCAAHAIAERTAETFQAAAAAKGVEIEVTGDDARVDIDSQLLAQTLAPLLDNAVRHAAAQARVEVARDGMTVVMTVSDDGPGVAAGSGEEIFEAGVSGDGGSGLGLPLARRLARGFGGELNAVESPGGGRFELRVPAGGQA